MELLCGSFLFAVGVIGCFLMEKNMIMILVVIELMFLGVSFNFGILSVCLDDIVGQIVVLFILVVAAAESALGLAMIVIYYRLRGVLNVSGLNLLKG